MRTLIKNGRVVTATDDYFADVLVDGETIAQIGKDLSSVTADQVIDARTGSSCRAGSIRTRTSTCPSAAPSAPTTSRRARSRRRSAARRP
ncbi:MAG: hypothetical protein M5U28_30685 [Sandaracinaceae bacterium]|nr:hypothetical protein [Sandaracinaceae bacterium]